MRHDDLPTIGARLTHVRGQKSQADFAPEVGIAKNTLGNYERGDREPGALALSAYVRLGWNSNWLLIGQGPERIEQLLAAKELAPYSSPRLATRDRETYLRATRIVVMAIGFARVDLEPGEIAQLIGDTYDKLLSQDFSGDAVLEINQGIVLELQRIQEEHDARSRQT